MTDYHDVLVDNLRTLMQMRGDETYAELAEHLDINPRSLRAIMTHDRQVSLDFLIKLSEATDYEPWQFIYPGFIQDCGSNSFREMFELLLSYWRKLPIRGQQDLLTSWRESVNKKLTTQL